MSDEVVRDFPLFPLGVVALPHELVPLHIFEDRYRTMIGECLERGSEFGIVWAADDGQRAVGCAMEIAEVLERMDDGRLNILTRGTRPFRIVEEHDDLPYPAGTVEFLIDKTETADAGTADSAHEAYNELVEQATDRTLVRRGARGDVRLPDGRDRRLRPRGQAGPARPALRERAAAARRPPVPRRAQAAGRSSSARRSGRARTGRSASAEEPGQPPLRAEPRPGEDERRARRSPRRSALSPSRTTP